VEGPTQHTQHPRLSVPSPGLFRKYLRFSTIGLELGLSVLIGLFGGMYLDRYFGTDPWLLILGLLFGMGAGFLSLFRLLKNLHDDPEYDE